MNRDKINGYGAILRFVTPILVTIALFILSSMQTNIRKIEISMTNHLEHHRMLEVGLGERLSSIESILRLYEAFDKRR